MNRLLSNYFYRNAFIRSFRIYGSPLKKTNSANSRHQLQALPFLPLIQYLLRGCSMVAGRLINRWWKKLPSSEKAKIVDKIYKNSKVIITTAGVATGGVGAVYYRNLEFSDISGRRRFMAIGAEELNTIMGEDYHEVILPVENVMSKDQPRYKFVKRIINTIVSKNVEKFPTLDREWKLLIIEDNDLINAACLPSGHVIVFTGLINFVENPHQLAAVISHEMSHVLLEHGREMVSRASVMSIALISVGFVLWTVVPGDITAFFSNFLKNRIAKVFLDLPYNRMLESEADVLGLELMARSCFRVEEAQRFWEIMDVFEKRKNVVVPEWLSTHPNSYLRAQLLKSHMPAAQKISKECGCFRETLISYFSRGVTLTNIF